MNPCRSAHSQGCGRRTTSDRRTHRRGSARKQRLDRSSRGLLCLLALARAQCPCEGLGETECSRLAPYFLAADQRIDLCRRASTSAPADCAREAHAAQRLSGSLILELCLGATSEMPGVCVAGLSKTTAKYLSSELRIDVCKDARSHAPAQCIEHSASSRKQPQLAVDVCRGASSVAPARCLDMLPRSVSHEAAVSLCNGVLTEGPAICANVQGQLSHGSELTSRLCQGASGAGPADCFRRSALATTLSMDDRVDLCKGAESDAPARCAGDIRDRRLSQSERVGLCRGSSSTAPAACLASVPPSMPSWDRVAVCQGAIDSSPNASAVCLKALPQGLSSALAAALCRGVSGNGGAECAKIARHTVGDSNELLMLCRGASSTAPAHCAKAAFHAGAAKHLAAVLCAGSTSLAPASCFAAAPKQIPVDLRAEACSAADSTGPAVCLAAAMPRGLPAPAGGAVCPLNPDAGRQPRRGLDYRLAARLCRDARNDNPAECARAAPLLMSDDDVEILCAAKGLPQGVETAKCAVAALMAGLKSTAVASLCRGASSEKPAACAATVSSRIGEADRLALCIEASSDAPARCANSLSIARAPSAIEIAECRTTAPQPSGLRIVNLRHEGEELFANQPMQATLEVQDQWGGVIPSDSSTVVRASIALRGSNGASVNANGRFNTSSEGFVHFSHISFSGSGSLTLQFSIDGHGGASIPLAAARVIVAETEHGAIVRRCRNIFSRLACPLVDDARETGEGTGNSVLTEAVSMVSGGTNAAWYVLTCQKVLEENGINVAYFSGDPGSFSAWLWYHPGIEILETGTGLPTRGQPAWEILGVERDARVRDVRRAYYRQSLLWHPDRWIRYAIHSARAQEVFETVSEAYTWMVSEEKDARTDNVDETLQAS